LSVVRRIAHRRPPLGRRVRILLAVCLGALAAYDCWPALEAPAQTSSDGMVRAGVPPDPAKVAAGQRLFEGGCSSCHGLGARGIPGRGPSLRGAGALAADFYLRTGRMPLDNPEDQPQRHDPAYDPRQIEDLVNYAASLGGPAIPTVDEAAGDLVQGERLFAQNCAGCHQIVGQGGISGQGVAPDFSSTQPLDVAEAVRIGPYVMPIFNSLTPGEIDALARYVDYTKHPEDVGGWALGHIGPIPEGMVAWLLAGLALLLTIRLIGERTP
jgi:ubiquinol-cytochrome c reductase cytochrome c subunit